MKKIVICSWLLIGMGLIFLGCKKGEEARDPAPAQVTRSESGNSVGEASAPNPTKAKESPMVVSVNDRDITLSDVDRATDMLMAQYRSQIPPDRAGEALTVLRRQAVENLINQNLLVEEADRQGVQPDKKAVDERYAEISGRFSSPEEFTDALGSMGVSKEEFREEITQDLKIEVLLDGQVKDVKKVTTEDVSAFYKDHPESFKSPEQVRASHILVSVDANASTEDRARKRHELAGLRSEIEKGADFGQLASQNSDCPSKAREGDLGYFERGKMVKPFEDAAFQMKVGDVSDIVETQFGYHLIKVTDHQDPKVATFDEVKDQIENLLNRQAKDEAIGEFLGKLRGSATITYAEGYQP